ncbi:MAG: glycosyltransferase family 4 protein [Candidatus Pacebacteria bacterium]|nr:glycosyltransferase family 4 protein [Candidatus Paceibacterota bacterium]
MKILIASGIYPPDIGGPAQYARNLYETWKGRDHDVKVAAYRWERAFPPLVRHFLYFLKIIRKGWKADLILVLDTWSAAVPTMLACSLMRKKYILRTGGDFLWETYAERTGDMVLFNNFYGKDNAAGPEFMAKLSFKERLVFKLGGAALRRAQVVIFSTQWQKNIFERAYKINTKKSVIVENYCGARMDIMEPENRTFLASTRILKWKNIDLLKEAFAEAQVEVKRRGLPDIDMDTSKAMYSNFVERMHRSYAVILASLGDISPNMIFDAVMTRTPFIVTKEIGITDRIQDAAIFIDPKNKQDIVDKIVWMADPANRAVQAKKVQALPFMHSWEDIAREILEIGKKK